MSKQETKTALDSINHIAICVPNVEEAVKWYTDTFNCQIDYQDKTWAYLRFNNIQLALVVPDQHPPHVCFVTAKAEQFGQLKTHRDGTRSCYVKIRSRKLS